MNKSLRNKLIKGAVLSGRMFMEGFVEEITFKLYYIGWVGFTCQEQTKKKGVLGIRVT